MNQNNTLFISNYKDSWNQFINSSDFTFFVTLTLKGSENRDTYHLEECKKNIERFLFLLNKKIICRNFEKSGYSLTGFIFVEFTTNYIPHFHILFNSFPEEYSVSKSEFRDTVEKVLSKVHVGYGRIQIKSSNNNSSSSNLLKIPFFIPKFSNVKDIYEQTHLTSYLIKTLGKHSTNDDFIWLFEGQEVIGNTKIRYN